MGNDVELAVEPNTAPRTAEERAALLAEPGFGRVFTDHMAIARWSADDGWYDARIQLIRGPSVVNAQSFEIDEHRLELKRQR